MNGFLRNERGGAARWIIILIIIAAGTYGYQYFKKTPRYALIQFKKAILFSNSETAQKFVDLDSVIRGLPESVTRGQPDEVVKKRLIYELDAPGEKSFFSSARDWSVITVPVTVSRDQLTATVQPVEGTSVTLEKTPEEYWAITAIQLDS